MNKTVPNTKDKEALEKIKPKEVTQTSQVDQKPDVKKTKKESPVEKQPQVQDTAGSINLVPTLSKEEVVVQESKKKMNIGSILSLLALVLISLGIVAFNIFTKMRLNNARDDLYSYENEIMGSSQKIINNNEILERVRLYEDIQTGAFSPKEVIDYINDIASKSGGNTQISDFVFGDDLSFSFSGSANDLEEVSKLWYLLTHDSKIEIVNLESVGKSSNGVRFDFEGQLVFDDFVNISITE